MLSLLLIGCFTAFLLAVIDPLIDVLAIFINAMAIKIMASLLFSFIGCWLADTAFNKTFILTMVAGAFVGSSLLAVAERIATYKPAVINAIRNNQN